MRPAGKGLLSSPTLNLTSYWEDGLDIFSNTSTQIHPLQAVFNNDLYSRHQESTESQGLLQRQYR